MSQPPLTVRERVQAASSGVRTLKRIDRAAAVLITLGGVGVVVAVIGILLFVAAEAWPLFAPASGHLAQTVGLAAAPAPSPAAGPTLVSTPGAAPAPMPEPTPSAASVVMPEPTPGAAPLAPAQPTPVEGGLAFGVDEYQIYVYDLRSDGRMSFRRMADGSFSREHVLPGLAGAALTAASRSPGDHVAAATADGRAQLVRVEFEPRYEAQKLSDLDIAVSDQGLVQVDEGRRAIRQISYRQSDGGEKTIAALVGDDEIAVWRASSDGTERRNILRTPAGEPITVIRVGGTDRVIAGTGRGNVYHWQLEPEPRLTSVSPTGAHPVTALEWIVGDITFVAGNAGGDLSAWFPVRLDDDDAEPTIVRAHTYAPQGAPVVALGISTRDKSFASGGADGTITLRHMTSERTLVSFKGESAARGLLVTPKGDGLLALLPGDRLARYEVSSPHPEITLGTLFGKTWYEGYAKPEFVWQSTGSTNEFEPKLSLAPLVFGTMKGTFYALLFAIPLAVLGALYTTQFMHPNIRARVKPVLEVMAALPSVVIGFIAGLWLAAIVEQWTVPILMMTVVMPLFGTSGFMLWRLMPRRLAKRTKPGMELLLIVALMLAGAWLCIAVGPLVERLAFGGDFKAWLNAAGMTYDQRNSIVVGIAMGFAVIPIIFTIADDAFASVPSSLTAGSLALGASRWQTALTVVLPTASPGVFSAVMVGFGRAVGETMIVLMATGNTPVLDWSIFNGMRTLSANVATEIPEAPHGGTLYRVLFLSAALLFAMTFVVNTIAEVIRQRLRERYRAL